MIYPSDAAWWLSRQVRAQCSACGSAAIDWYGLGDAVDELPGPVFDRLCSALDGLNPAEVEPEFWRCRNCQEAGVFLLPVAS